MISGTTVKSKRVAAGIAGYLVCKKAGIARSRLSDIERGYVTATPDDLTRINAALDFLIEAKAAIQNTAAAVGWPIGEVR